MHRPHARPIMLKFFHYTFERTACLKKLPNNMHIFFIHANMISSEQTALGESINTGMHVTDGSIT